MIPTLDRAFIYFVSGIIAGVLESTGILDSAQHSVNTDTIQAVAGPLIVLVSIILAFKHERHKTTLQAGVPDNETSLNLTPIIDFLVKAKIFKQTTTQPQIPADGV